MAEGDRTPLTLPVVQHRVSRRGFLRASLALVAGVGGGVLTGCEFDPDRDREIIIPPDQTEAYADVVPLPPYPEDEDDEPYEPQFFTPEEAETVEAFTARLFPGSPDDPGAREAGVLRYIDLKLALVEGFWQPTYFAPPFPETYEGEPPSDELVTPERVLVAEEEIDRYGFQSSLTPREIYRQGLASVDELARQRFGARFAELSEEEQDEIVGAIADDEADTFDEPSAERFFETIREDTGHGVFADPAYGGNREMVG